MGFGDKGSINIVVRVVLHGLFCSEKVFLILIDTFINFISCELVCRKPGSISLIDFHGSCGTRNYLKEPWYWGLNYNESFEMVYNFSLISTAYDFDEAFTSGDVPLDDNHDMLDYENRQLRLAQAAGAGKYDGATNWR